MESISACEDLQTIKNHILLKDGEEEIQNQFMETGGGGEVGVTKMGINVTLTPLVEVPDISNGMDTEGGDEADPDPQSPDACDQPADTAPDEILTNNVPAEDVIKTSGPTNNSSLSLSEDEIINLKQCRNRAYSKVNQKKRMHLNASLSQYLQKEWIAIYPSSKLSGKQLVDLFDSHSNSSKVAADGDDPPRSKRGRKRKVTPSSPPAPAPASPEKPKKPRTDSAEGGEAVVSTSTHGDRQWSDAMLCNLMYCNVRAQINQTDLEKEWLNLYPNSLLTARNLKSRLTVYQRTHSEKSAPKKPTKEKEEDLQLSRNKSLLQLSVVAEPAVKLTKSSNQIPKKRGPKPKHLKNQTNLNGSGVVDPLVWTEAMIKDMFDTLDQAREEMNSTDTNLVNPRWYQIWLLKYPATEVDQDTLYHQYLSQVRKASQSLSSSNDKENKIQGSSQTLQQLTVKSQSQPNYQWTETKLGQLMEEKIYVEEKLRCIQDDHFFELLQERWAAKYPECREGPEELKTTLLQYESNIMENKNNIKSELGGNIKNEPLETDTLIIKEEDDDEMTMKLEEEDVKMEYELSDDPKEEPSELSELPKSKWVCPNHFIHVFYDDQDKNVECILTDQLLQMRNSLISKFPGQDLFKSGKKPTGFAKQLLSSWLALYPDSQENTKSISMKIGRYDRAPQVLLQDTKMPSGRINWSPAMIENIKTCREKAIETVGANPGLSMTRQWRLEWEKLYPDLSLDWKQVMSRYHYHFGVDRRDSQDSARSARNSCDKSSLDSDNEEGEAREDIRGFRQWTSSLQEDLLILKDILLQRDPHIDTDSKAFSRQLLALFKDKHPNCMESERSLLLKLKESSNSSSSQMKEIPKKPKPVKAAAVEIENPALNIMSDIDGFTDWNLGRVRDFISCMDRARRKYTDKKETDPQLKLVPLLLEEWKIMYPDTSETVRTFLVRIRFLKTNKESIKAKLGQHDLLPRMSQEEAGPSGDGGGGGAGAAVKEEQKERPEDKEEFEPVVHLGKFVWDANTMMPIVIATRAKAIAKQKREATHGRRISYAKIWIKEFQKVYPNCPYTPNNLSVHYWYWTSRQENKEDKVEKKASEAVEENRNNNELNWSAEHLEELRRVGEKVNQMLRESQESSNGKHINFSKLVHSVWLNLHPSSSETENSLLAVYNRAVNQVFSQRTSLEDERRLEERSLSDGARWTPRHNKVLREIITNLRGLKAYTRINVVKEWQKYFPKLTWQSLADRIDDCGFSQPEHVVRLREEKVQEKKSVPSKIKTVVEAESGAGLNARGQMRWTQQAVQDLLECHKLGLKAKNSQTDRKLADLVHQKFKQRHPYCPIAPNVLLTKCYILRSELKSGKLVLNDSKEDTGEKYRGESGLRTWTRQMLDELVASRKRAITRRKMGTSGQLLGDIWLDEFRLAYPDYRSSKKNLFRKYKWWRQRRAEMEKDVSRTVGKINIAEEPVLFSELSRSLSETSVELPPFVSSKVIMLAQHWVEHSQAREEETEKVEEEEAEAEPGSLGMITLPGGAVLVAKSGSSSGSVDNKAGRVSEPPDVSITLSSLRLENTETLASSEIKLEHFSSKNDSGVSITLCNNKPASPPSTNTTDTSSGTSSSPGVPPAILSILDTIGLPLALLPTLLAVYRDVRDTYKVLVAEGYCVSWSTLLTARLKSAWPGTSVSIEKMDQLVEQTLSSASITRSGLKVIRRPGPVIPPGQITTELLTSLQEHVDSFDRHVPSAWQNWRGFSELSAKQFSSLAQFLCPPGDTTSTSTTYNWDEMMWQAELCEVWSTLWSTMTSQQSPAEGAPDIEKPRRKVRTGGGGGGEDNELSLNNIGRWIRKVGNVPVNSRHLAGTRRPRFVANNIRLFWNNQKVSKLKQSRQNAHDRWRVMAKRKYNKLGEMIVNEFRSLTGVSAEKLTSNHILAKLSQIQRMEISRASKLENREWNKRMLEYQEYLDNEDYTEAEGYVEDDEPVHIKETDDEDLPNYSLDAEVIEYIREKEGGKKMMGNVWSSATLTTLLKARDIAQTRRAEWERWAVSKHGSLTAAYSNPRVKVPKVEELMMEEWSQLRPNQSGVSAWTLNSHLKKFEAIKKQLMEEQQEEKKLRELRMAPPKRIRCHPNTDIPVFNLAALNHYPKLPANVKKLISSRQRALTASPQSGLSYLVTWADLWLEETGQRVEGWRLRQQLHKLQGKHNIRNKLRRFMDIRTVLPGSAEEKTEVDLDSFEYQSPEVTSRDSTFPHAEDQISDILIRRKSQRFDDYEDEFLIEIIGEGRLDLPVIIDRRDILEEPGIQFRPKSKYMETEEGELELEETNPMSQSKFYNLNNFENHLQLQRIGGKPEKIKTFGQRMAAHRHCSNLVLTCLSSALDQCQ